jgi:hypothetical protein
MNETLERIVTDLIAKTKAKKAIWVSSGISSEYMMYLSEYSINIRERLYSEEDRYYVIRVCENRSSEDIYKFEPGITVNNRWYILLRELYEVARDTYNDFDGVCEKILGEINQNETIGVEISHKLEWKSLK